MILYMASEGNDYPKKIMFSELFKDTSNRQNESSISSLPVISSDSQHQEHVIDEDDFMAELTRQMAHYMLDENVDPITGLHTSKNENINSNELAMSNQRRPMIQTKKRHNSYGARPSFSPVSCPGASPQRLDSGSGINCWVLFLGGNGSTNGSSTRGGTGVFLPRLTPDPYHTRNKRSATRRCSTVLIPTKVMQVLQLHYSKNVDVNPKTSIYYNNRPDTLRSQYLMKNLRVTQYHSRYLEEMMTKEHHQDIGLPKEWTY